MPNNQVTSSSFWGWLAWGKLRPPRSRARTSIWRLGIIVYRFKTDTGFAIPVFPQVRLLVEKLCQGKKPSERLFKISQARAALRNACRRLDFPRYSHRSLRRCFITRAIELGVDVKVIATWQGHRDGGKLILDTYSHVRPEHSNRMAQLMSDEAPANVVPMHQAS